MDNSTKILLLGKTGVGKSAFINYFLGKDVAKSDDGKPVTQDYFIPYEIKDGKYPVTVFDTKGIEAMGADKQLNYIIDEVKKRNNSANVFNWFHTIFYCVSMGDPRFQDFESNLINTLSREICQHIHIIITHCDAASKEKILEMRKKIESALNNLDSIEIFEVICINKKKRDGTSAVQQGKEAVSERVFDLLIKDIAYKISAEYANTLYHALVNVADQTLNKVNRTIDEMVNLKNLIKIIKEDGSLNIEVDKVFNELEENLRKVQEQTDRKFNEIMIPIADLYLSYKGIVTNSFAEDASLLFDDAMLWMNMDWFENFDEVVMIKRLFPKLKEKGYINEYGDFLEIDEPKISDVFKLLISGIGDFLSIKKNIKAFVLDIYCEFIHSIPNTEQLQKNAYNRIVDVMTQ